MTAVIPSTQSPTATYSTNSAYNTHTSVQTSAAILRDVLDHATLTHVLGLVSATVVVAPIIAKDASIILVEAATTSLALANHVAVAISVLTVTKFTVSSTAMGVPAIEIKTPIAPVVPTVQVVPRETQTTITLRAAINIAMLACFATLLKLANMNTIHTTRGMGLITSDVTIVVAARVTIHQVHDILRRVVIVFVIGLDNDSQAN